MKKIDEHYWIAFARSAQGTGSPSTSSYITKDRDPNGKIRYRLHFCVQIPVAESATNTDEYMKQGCFNSCYLDMDDGRYYACSDVVVDIPRKTYLALKLVRDKYLIDTRKAV